MITRIIEVEYNPEANIKRIDHYNTGSKRIWYTNGDREWVVNEE